jgi:DNA-binding MarR family transcriptional regulator
MIRVAALHYVPESIAVTDTGCHGLFAVLHASSVLQERVEARLADVNLSVAKLAALRHLSRAGDSLPLGQLAERLACVKSNVTQLVDRLEADGLVTRAFDPADRRSRLAVLTEKGRQACTLGGDIQNQAEQELFSPLSADEATELRRLLTKLTSSPTRPT